MNPILEPTGALTCHVVTSACSDAPRPLIFDRPQGAKFQQDISSCRPLFQQKTTPSNGPNGGAIIGALVGAADENADLNAARGQIVFNCLREGGHNVV